MLACEKGDSEVKGASNGDCGPGQWPEEAMLPGLATDESGESGGKRGLRMMSLKLKDGGGKVLPHLLPRPFWPKETLWGIAGSGTLKMIYPTNVLHLNKKMKATLWRRSYWQADQRLEKVH